MNKTLLNKTSKRVAISQPTYLPWLGYLKMIQSVDVFVFLDNVQFQKQSWQSRNRIKTHLDETLWLSVPTKNHGLGTPISEVMIADKSNWQRKHINSIQTYLGKTLYCAEVQELLQSVFEQPLIYLADLNIELITSLCSKLNINTKLVRASDLNVAGSRTDLLLDILTKLNADEYLANLGSKSYLKDEHSRFDEVDIAIEYHEWSPPFYEQKGNQFIDKLAWVDAVSYMGFAPDKLLNSPTDTPTEKEVVK